MADALPAGDVGTGRFSKRWDRTASQGRYLVLLVGVAALYDCVAQLGYSLEFAGPVAAVVWLPVGVGIATLYLGGMRFWPGILAGDLLANDYSTLPWGSALGQTTGNVLEVVVTTLLLKRLIDGAAPLHSASSVARMVGALAVGTGISATVGVLSLRLGNVFATDAIRTVWRTWWLADLSGALVVFPLALAWYPFPRSTPSRARTIEAMAMILAVAVLSEFAFHGSGPLVYLTFPGLLWAAPALRAARRHGRHRRDGRHRRVGHHAPAGAVRVRVDQPQHAQPAAVRRGGGALDVAAGGRRRRSASASRKRLSAARMRMVESADEERRRIARNIHDGAQQRLVALAVHLRLGEEDARNGRGDLEPVVAAARQELELAMDELRELAHGVHSERAHAARASAVRWPAWRSARRCR